MDAEVLDISQFEILGCEDLNNEDIGEASLTYWQDVWRRYKANKLAMLGAVMLLLVSLIIIFGPTISGYNFKEMNYKDKNLSPSTEHFFGTDDAGRDIFTRVAVGGRVSLLIGLTCTFVMFIIGSTLGAIAGFKGGFIDGFIMRCVEIVGSLPYLVVVILISLLMGRSLFSLIFAMTIMSWGNTTRLVRGQILQIKNMEFVMAAKALGADTKRIISKHLLPNAMGIIIVSVTFSIPGFIFGEAFLSYIGIGIQPPQTSWGALASSAQQQLMFNPYQLFFPCLMIVTTMMAFQLIGDGLTDALDPKLRQ